MIYDNVLQAIGHTPMIRLNRMNSPENAEVLVKFEGLNVGGSIKTRTAFNMIEQAEKEGLINKDTIIVEPTSGNQGIGLAVVGAVRGYRTIIIMPDSVSEERRKLMEHYGAEVVLIHDDDNIGECIKECLETSLGLGIKSLVQPGHISLMKLMDLMSKNPAEFYRLTPASITEGAVADIVIFGENELWKADKFESKAKNTPFIGWELPGKVHYTICDGNIVYSDK